MSPNYKATAKLTHTVLGLNRSSSSSSGSSSSDGVGVGVVVGVVVGLIGGVVAEVSVKRPRAYTIGVRAGGLESTRLGPRSGFATS